MQDETSASTMCDICNYSLGMSVFAMAHARTPPRLPAVSSVFGCSAPCTRFRIDPKHLSLLWVRSMHVRRGGRHTTWHVVRTHERDAWSRGTHQARILSPSPSTAAPPFAITKATTCEAWPWPSRRPCALFVARYAAGTSSPSRSCGTPTTATSATSACRRTKCSTCDAQRAARMACTHRRAHAGCAARLSRVNVFTAADDHVHLAADDAAVPVWVCVCVCA